ncbi:hypothetical protein DOJK_00320 [Patescibacteria group bacterium]|nr:hypothetical protein DOJK_00320 [Patescibacteria group bacterium]
MANINFDREYYKNLIAKHGYQELNISAIDFNLGDINKDILQRKWLCHSKGYIFAKELLDKKSIVTTGIGISGAPHMGTLGQIFNSIFLQNHGINTQFVLGDLDAYNGKKLSLSYVKELSEQYKSFITKLGYSTTDGNILRNQFDASEVTRTMYLIAKFIEDKDFDNVEEDLHNFYSDKGKVDKDMSFRRKTSLTLMTADFIDLVINHSFTNVLVTLGVDEHKYVLFSEKILERVIESGEILPSDSIINFGAMYTHIIRGFNNYPKMSKSFPDSSINIEMKSDEIRNRILNERTNKIPEEDTVYQMMCLVSKFNSEELSKRYIACKEDKALWMKYKNDYIEYLIDIFKLW